LTMGRDSKGGRGKTSGRGSGRRMFIANEDELEIRNREVSEHSAARKSRRAESDEESGGEDEVEATEGAEAGESVFKFDKVSKAVPNVEEEPRSKGLLGHSESVNPNHQKNPVEKMSKIKNMNDATATPVDPEAGMNRKEREALAAIKAKEDYQKRYMAGETEQARKDLARLAEVRAKREAAAKLRELEGRKPGMSATGIESSSDSDSSDEEEDGKGPKPVKPAPAPKPVVVSMTVEQQEKAAIVAKKKAAAAAEPEAADGPPKLKAMDIKKLNGDALKDACKERNLDFQGQKKDLMKRLIDYEAARA